jgi:hypothetical protein
MKIRKQLVVIVLALLCLFVAIGCRSDSDDANSNNEPAPVQEVDNNVTSLEVGSNGGIIELPGGATLEIPSGALTEPTTISVITPAEQGASSQVIKYELQPAGLEFDVPLILRVPLEDVPELGMIEALQWSDLNPLEGEGDLSRFQPLDELEGSSREELVLAIEHFSFVFIFVTVSEYMYLVKDIPARFLLPGDLLFTLTQTKGGVDWQPGHVGVFIGGRNDCNMLPSDALIEATGDSVREDVLDRHEPDEEHRGVREGFRAEFGHKYLGPRRSYSEPLTPADRVGVVDFLREQVGKDYALILGQGNLDEDAFSCVGLAEAALDSVDKGVIAGLNEALVSTPLEMFQLTGPIDDITVFAGESVEIPFSGAIVHPASPDFLTTTRGWYCNTQPCCDAGACNSYEIETKEPPPSGITFDKISEGEYLLKWDTTEDDAGRHEILEFLMTSNATTLRDDADDASDRATLGVLEVEDFLSIKVLPCPLPEDPVCGDETKDESEACDGEAPPDSSCEDLGLGSGELGCTPECEVDTSGCAQGAMCGNMVAEAANGEDCDAMDLGALPTCEDHDLVSGTLSCSMQCTYDLTQCETCGNGVINDMTAELCDGLDLDGLDCTTVPPQFGTFDGGTLRCDSNCLFDTSGCTVAVANCETPAFTNSVREIQLSSNGPVLREDGPFMGSDVDAFTNIVDDMCVPGTSLLQNTFEDYRFQLACDFSDALCAMFTRDVTGMTADVVFGVFDTAAPAVVSWTPAGIAGITDQFATPVLDVNGNLAGFIGSASRAQVAYLDAAGTLVDSWTVPQITGVNATLGRLSVERGQAAAMTDGTNLYVYVPMRDYYSPGDPQASEHFVARWTIEIATGTTTLDEQSLEFIDLDGFNQEKGLVMLRDGTAVAMTRQPLGSTLKFTEFDASFVPTVTNVPLMGTGTLLDSRLGYYDGVGYVLGGIVDDGAQTTLNAWFLGTTIPAMIDVDAGTVLSTGNTGLDFVRVSPTDAWIVSDAGGDVVYRVPVP